jgi:hypothetical protein
VAKPSETPGLEDITITLTRLSPIEVEEVKRDLERAPGVKKVSQPSS